MTPLKQARELHKTLEELQKTDCEHVRNEVAQLMCLTLNADTEYPPEPEIVEEIRERTEALLKGIKHPKRRDR